MPSTQERSDDAYLRRGGVPAHDRFDLPKWCAGRMEAVVSGAIDYDDIEPLVIECADIADKAIAPTQAERRAKAKADGQIDLTPSWSGIAGIGLRSLLEVQIGWVAEMA
jgi:hypothetical protein